MEYLNIGSFPEGEWDSLTKMFVSEDLDFMAPQFFSAQSPFFPDINGCSESLFQTLDSLNSELHYLSQESSHSTSTNSNSGTHETYNYFVDNAAIIPDPSFLPNDSAFGSEITLKRPLYDSGDDDKANVVSNPKKKARVSNARKGKKNGKAEDEVSHASNSSSEDDNASDEKAVTPSGGKARASRGSATDPQSLYARKRRERINERLRILQNIVPNGTKVDISTMLEEAVHYVKFLQLQIKLLSSDEMWMYAPLAYNGMDLGLNQKLSQLV